jgi:hypothetical protein
LSLVMAGMCLLSIFWGELMKLNPSPIGMLLQQQSLPR